MLEEFRIPKKQPLVGGFNHLKNISQNGNLPQVGVNIKNIWNQHLDQLVAGNPWCFFFKPKGRWRQSALTLKYLPFPSGRWSGMVGSSLKRNTELVSFHAFLKSIKLLKEFLSSQILPQSRPLAAPKIFTNSSPEKGPFFRNYIFQASIFRGKLLVFRGGTVSSSSFVGWLELVPKWRWIPWQETVNSHFEQIQTLHSHLVKPWVSC